MRLRSLLVLIAALALSAQLRPPEEPRMPDGRSQKEEILKSEHAKSLEDAGELIQLAEDVKIELEKNDRHIVSVKTLKKLDEIEKLTKRIRSRLKRY